jgi:hypothetical protein
MTRRDLVSSTPGAPGAVECLVELKRRWPRPGIPSDTAGVVVGTFTRMANARTL